MENLARKVPLTNPGPANNDVISAGTPIKRKPAGFWRRFAATMLDGVALGIILSPITIGLSMLMGGFSPPPEAGPDLVNLGIQTGISYLFQFVAIYFYFGYFYSKKGASPGKMVLNLKIVDTNAGRNPGYWKAFFRETIGKALSALSLGIGFLMVVFRKDGKALHDIVFSTQVLHEPKE